MRDTDIASRKIVDKRSKAEERQIEKSIETVFRAASEQTRLLRQIVDTALMAGRHAEILEAQDRIFDTEGMLRSVELFLTHAHDVRSLYRNYKALNAPVEKE